MAYQDSDEVKAERQRTEERLTQINKKYNVGLDVVRMRTDALVEYLIDRLPARDSRRTPRDEAELFFLDKLHQSMDDLEPELAKAVLLQKPATPPGYVTPEEQAVIRELRRKQ